MRSTTSLVFFVALALLGGCQGSIDPGRGEGYATVETHHCELSGAGALGPARFEGAVSDDSGTWSHDSGTGDVFAGTADWTFCSVNGARVADVRGPVTWNGVSGYTFRLHVQDRGVSTTTRLPVVGTTTVGATRYYSPSRWEDGSAVFADGADVTVPESLPVTVGNAGNHWARLTFVEHESGDAIRCSYRGGASTSNPTRAADVAAGLSYELARCERFDHGCWTEDASIGAGSSIEVGSVELHVQQGSSRYPSRESAQTTIALELETIEYETVTTEQDFYQLSVFPPTGPAVFTSSGDLDSGDLAISLL